MIITIPIQSISGAYIRWYYNGWHYWMFSRKYEITDSVQTRGIMITERFSQVSRIEEPTSKIAKKFIDVGDQSLSEANYEAIKNILQSEHVQIYINSYWFELEIDRGSFTVRRNQMNAFDVIFRAEIKDAATAEARLILPPEEVIDEDPSEDPPPPDPEEEPIPDITLTTKTGTAGTFSITGTGGESITKFGMVTEHGMEYRILGGVWNKKVVGSALTSNSFTTSLSGLLSGTLYTYRAYVKAGLYTYYGANKSLTTLTASATLSFGSLQNTYDPMPSGVNDQYARLRINTLPDDSTYVTIQIKATLVNSSLGAAVYWRKNGLSWVQAHSFTAEGEVNLTIPATGYFKRLDVIDLRLELTGDPAITTGGLSAQITGGTVVQGTVTLVVGDPDTIAVLADFSGSGIGGGGAT